MADVVDGKGLDQGVNSVAEAWAVDPTAEELARPSLDERHLSPEEEIERLQQELEERQAAIRRQQGATFLLTTQVKQLEQQVFEASKDAQACSSQLAQVLSLMDSAGGRVPLKGEVERARKLVTDARRTIRRIACLPVEDPRGLHETYSGRIASFGGASASSAAAPAVSRGNGGGHHTDRRSSPRGRPSSPRGTTAVQPRNQRNGDQPAQGLAASAAAAVAEADSGKMATNGAIGATHRSASQAPTSKSEPRPKGSAKDGPRSRRMRASAGGQAQEMHEGLPMTPTASPFNTAGSLGGGGADTAPTPGVQSESSPRSAVVARTGQLAEVQQQFLRQREMLLLALRKGAQMEEKHNSMRDDLIRKDVVIHNLRQELTGVQQETKQQQLQYEQQTQQLQTHLQQLQQVRQMQEMQVLLQQQQLQFQQSASESATVPT
eukprot:CAMPEP_0197682774 /NCGR_PEP_ID=MMETSP1338-20131121/96972_1 /TAXON_ID=43686 ORGANISM="Pelagodinium beii, Strain RCC1491" /NCGR_SAMPLE_ID=MMETSP1338 /ASSEMBLY_ACC=CAM_ASM_000754 /LENGTH=434 /DNA_ID=CAMNT_0043264275 /DNA_START=15 /DNA_END=1315 /DNA_ORIENTATION=+